MRKFGKTDRNQSEIVEKLRASGLSVLSLAPMGRGCPDLVVSAKGSLNFLFEVKDCSKSPSQRKLTPDEALWHAAWSGQVNIICSAEDVFEVLKKHGVNPTI